MIAPGIVLLAHQLFVLQQKVLPMPSSQGEVTLFPGAPGEHTVALLLLVAMSPAICEELFFRGALLSGLRRDLPTFRIIAAAGTSLVIGMLVGPSLINRLRFQQHGISNVREDTPESHQKKKGTPT